LKLYLIDEGVLVHARLRKLEAEIIYNAGFCIAKQQEDFTILKKLPEYNVESAFQRKSSI